MTYSANLSFFASKTSNTGNISITGTALTLQDATDNTKTANFVLSGLTTGTNFTYTLPAVTGVALASLGNISQTFLGATTFAPTTAESTLILGSTTGTGTLTLGRSTVSQTANIATGATANLSTKTINIGTGGLLGSNTTITIGGTAGISNTILNGTVTSANGFSTTNGLTDRPSTNYDIATTLYIHAGTGINIGQSAGGSLTFGDGFTPSSLYGTPSTMQAYVNNNSSTNQLWYGSSNGLVVGNGDTPAATLDVRGGTTTLAPLKLTTGTLLTTPVEGAIEFSGSEALFFTPNTTSGRSFISASNYRRLIAAGTAIGNTIANFFGGTSNISLVANDYYEIEIYMLAARGSSAGTATITLTNSAAPTLMFVDYEQSPITGVVTPPGGASNLRGTTTTTSAAYSFTTGSLTASVNHFFRFKIWLRNGSGTSLKIQMTAGTGNNSMTPQAGSYYTVRILPNGQTGTFSA